MARYKVYLDEVSEASRELTNYSQNDIRNKIEELRELIDSIEWTGPAHDKFIEKSNEKITNLRMLNDKICLLGKHLENVHENYNNTSSDVNNLWNKTIDEMRVKE